MSATVKNNFQEYDPRHRLTGAVVLILLAIILLPMLLSKEQDAKQPEAEPAVMEVTIGSKKVFVSRISSATREESSEDNEGEKITSSSKTENEAKTTSPSAKKSEKATGKITLFRPSNKYMDKTYTLKLDDQYQMKIPVDKTMRSGLWRVQVDWENKGKKYYSEEDIVI